MNTIDREHVKKVFREYVNQYDAADEKVKLKIGHTYRVADLCERIAVSERMEREEADLAWLLGMLHDIGRFEQLRRFHTFIDAESIDHAALGADILFGREGEHEETRQLDSTQENVKRIRQYIYEEEEDELIETAIRVHSAYRIPENLSERTAKFCHILRDADKIDILRVNMETPLEEIYNTTTEELKTSTVSEQVMQAFYEHHAILRALRKTTVDHVVGHISLTYELVFPESLAIVKEQGYLEQLMNFASENSLTRAQFQELRMEMRKFLENNK